MKTLQKTTLLLFTFSTLLITSCSTESDDPNNNDPGLFSANALGTGIDTGNVEWTESTDIDDDSVTYAIFLEGEEIASGVTTRSYDFFGLEPDTGYAGYVEARDGRGGTSRANFDFLTEPEVIIFTVNASWWIYDQFPEVGGLRTSIRSGFIVPYYEDATKYQIEIIDWAFAGFVRINDQDQNGKIYTWTNEFQSSPIGDVFADKPAPPADFSVAFAATGINTLSGLYDTAINDHTASIGEARVYVTIGK